MRVGFYGFAYIGEVITNQHFIFKYSSNVFSFIGMAEIVFYKKDLPKYDWYIIGDENNGK